MRRKKNLFKLHLKNLFTSLVFFFIVIIHALNDSVRLRTIFFKYKMLMEMDLNGSSN